jgi:hypothetical protein
MHASQRARAALQTEKKVMLDTQSEDAHGHHAMLAALDENGRRCKRAPVGCELATQRHAIINAFEAVELAMQGAEEASLQAFLAEREACTACETTRRKRRRKNPPRRLRKKGPEDKELKEEESPVVAALTGTEASTAALAGTDTNQAKSTAPGVLGENEDHHETAAGYAAAMKSCGAADNAADNGDDYAVPAPTDPEVDEPADMPELESPIFDQDAPRVGRPIRRVVFSGDHGAHFVSTGRVVFSGDHGAHFVSTGREVDDDEAIGLLSDLLSP